ncbi:MAG TPA: MaoC family dehydratase [Afifellaceae bacterium]|nr:MaoC family dehydratase [Afifellaceae bacterium]
MKFFDDIPIGHRIELGRHTFTPGDIKGFAARFDAQPFHLDEDAAARSHFGRLCASGWHTASVWMRHFVRYGDRVRREAEQAGIPAPHFGPSPGFEALKWLKPVYAGDTIAFALTFLDKRDSRSRPGWGLVTMLAEGTNDAGDTVISFKAQVFVEKREAP